MTGSRQQARRLAALSRAPLVGGLVGGMLRMRRAHWQVRAAAWRGRAPLRIVILSDIHWGFAPMGPARLKAAKARAQATSPDIVVFLGDLAGGWGPENKPARVRTAAGLLAGMHAPLGCYAILGNHDWHDDPQAQARRAPPVAAAAYLGEAGFRVLQNQAIRVPGRGDFWLAGLDSQQAICLDKGRRKIREGRDDLAGTLAQAPGADPVILLAHEPDIFPELDQDRVALTLSGHTHAGQVRPFGRPIYVPSRHGTRFAYGHHVIAQRHLVVSAGLGATALPLRYGAVPEVTVVDLAAPEGPAWRPSPP